MDATRAEIEFTAEVCAIAVEEGATGFHSRYGLATEPRGVRRIFAGLYELVPGLKRDRDLVHCHDDLGLAVANSYAGRWRGSPRSSVRSTESASGPETATLEEIVMLIRPAGPPRPSTFG